MSGQPRITPEMIREAMAQFPEMEIVARNYGDGTTCGCPQTILARAANVPPPTAKEREQTIDGGELAFATRVMAWGDNAYGDEYAYGFRRGFDRSEFLPSESPRAMEGYTDGQACRDALLPGWEHSRAW